MMCSYSDALSLNYSNSDQQSQMSTGLRSVSTFVLTVCLDALCGLQLLTRLPQKPIPGNVGYLVGNYHGWNC